MTGTEAVFVGSNGAQVPHVVRSNSREVVVFWFSAFTRGPHLGRLLKVTPGFHGFRFSSVHDQFDWVLLRDQFGYTQDGTYYGGRAGDLFVESAVNEFVSGIIAERRRLNPDVRFVMIGSSMGAFAAIKFAVLNRVPAFGWSPHLDVEIAMNSCGRGPWVRHCIEGGSPDEVEEYLHRMERVLVSHSGQLPDLILQAAKDDPFVYPEQVVPFVDRYRSGGGQVQLDLRESGGHSSTHAPDEYVIAAITSLASGTSLDLEAMRRLPPRKVRARERFEGWLQRVEARLLRILRFFGIRR